MNATETGAHDEVQRLLPWYANGTLVGAELQEVERHLAICSQCRDEVERCRDEIAAVRSSAIDAPAPHPAGFARLTARIDEEEARRDRPRRWLRALKRALVGSGGSGTLRWALVAQMAVIAILAGLLLRSPEMTVTTDPAAPEAARFQTRSAPAAEAASGRLRVVFTADSTTDAVRQLLLEIQAEVVAGPSPLGVYTLALRSEEPVAVVLEHLRAQPVVRFAESVQPELER